jgi:hypothetical protein
MLRNRLVAGSAAVVVGCGSGFDAGSGATATAGSGAASASAAGSGGSSASSGTSTTASTASGSTSNAGCADGTREAYPDAAAEPNIAGCDGRFQLGGVTGTPQPQCNRQAGNSGAVSDGAGCNVADLCAVGWHVCAGPGEVQAHAKSGQCPLGNAAVLSFWLTTERWNNVVGCNHVDNNNLVGCGNTGANTAAAPNNCAPLSAVLRHDAHPGEWYAGTIADASSEAGVVYKIANGGGGVLCCRNP